jgi:protein-L-isoaspartate(D-aspartate) O-methyltransferase
MSVSTTSDFYAEARRRMVDTQLLERRISPRVAAALGRVPRELFVGDDYERLAYADTPLPIKSGQTISQPYIVALTVDLAKVRPGDKVLDVGTGSGYAAAVLAELGADVHSIERIPELAESARQNLEHAGYDVTVHVGDGSLGLAEEAPFQAIVVAAAAPGLPEAYVEQIAEHGRIVLPLKVTASLERLVIWVNRPRKASVFESIPCRFVTLIGAAGYPEQNEDSE